MPAERLAPSFEKIPEIEFDFFLAAELHMTVADMRRRMSHREWMQWNVYYAKQKQEIDAKTGG